MPRAIHGFGQCEQGLGYSLQRDVNYQIERKKMRMSELTGCFVSEHLSGIFYGR